MKSVNDYAIGDTVRHPDGAIGRVVHFGPEGYCRETCVHVEWGPVLAAQVVAALKDAEFELTWPLFTLRNTPHP